MNRRIRFSASAWLVPILALGVAGCAGPGPREAGSSIRLRDTGHPVLLLVDAGGLERSRPRKPADRWYDLEWDNVLTQGFGGCDVADLSALPGVLQGRQLVVLPRRTSNSLGPDAFDHLAREVTRGLDVLFEAPDSTACQRVGLLLAATERRKLLPWPTPHSRSGIIRPELRPQPLEVEWTRLRYAPRPGAGRKRAAVQSSLDGRPLGWILRDGPGAWHVLAMDFAELSARLREFPRDATSRALDAAWLDAWIEGVCGVPLTRLPAPRIAQAPPHADGWVIAEHSVASPAVAVAGTDAPHHRITPSGHQSSGLVLPTRPAEDTTSAERILRANPGGGGGVVHFASSTPTDSTLVHGLLLAGERHDHRAATAEELRAWWQARSDVRISVEGSEREVDLTIDHLPVGAGEFGLLVPVRWQNLTLAGWDADWGLAPGRRVQRFDRGYRLITLDPAARGRVLQLRYR